jgi:hypothetical protein
MFRSLCKLSTICGHTPIRRYADTPTQFPIRQYVPLLATAVLTALSACAGSSQRSDLREYALAVGRPYPNELAVAQERVSRYLARLTPSQRSRVMENEYLAVEATRMPASDVPGLGNRIARGEVQATGGFGGDPYNRMSAVTSFVMIFETKTGRPATDEGFVVVDTPSKGRTGIFGGYTALFIGTGK